jgi:hypothetical protein
VTPQAPVMGWIEICPFRHLRIFLVRSQQNVGLERLVVGLSAKAHTIFNLRDENMIVAESGIQQL